MRRQSFLRYGFGRSGFTPKSALPIIAPLGGGPSDMSDPRLGLMPPTGLFLEGGRWSPFLFGVRFSVRVDALMRLLEPPIEALRFELVDVEFARGGQGGVLRIFIDRR